MGHYGTLKNYRFPGEEADDIRGSEVYSPGDEKVGKIDDVIFEHGKGTVGYVVINHDTDKYLVRPERLRDSQAHKNSFELDLDRAQIDRLPRYREADLESAERWEDYEKRYKEAEKSWTGGQIQHRLGSDHNITPTPDEMPAQSGPPVTNAGGQRVTGFDRVIPAASNEQRISNTGVGIGSRWSTFESRLLERRREITEACPSCRNEPMSERPPEDNDLERRVG